MKHVNPGFILCLEWLYFFTSDPHILDPFRYLLLKLCLLLNMYQEVFLQRRHIVFYTFWCIFVCTYEIYFPTRLYLGHINYVTLLRKSEPQLKFFLCFYYCLAVNMNSKDKKDSEILPTEGIVWFLVELSEKIIKILISTVINEDLCYQKIFRRS